MQNTTKKTPEGGLPATNCSLLLGDCLERMKEIPDGSVDMILCDLSYGTTACKWDTVIPFEPLWAHSHQIVTFAETIIPTIKDFFSLI